MNTQRRIVSLFSWVAFSFCVFSSPSMAAGNDTKLVKKAQQCRLITGRLERLDCFDRVFKTPIQVAQKDGEAFPEAWQRAMDAAHQDGDKDRALVTQGEGRGSSAWIALTATNDNTQFKGNAKPVLLMGCMNNLSRVELALPQPVEDGRIRVAVAGGDQQYWRSDDLGVLMSSARGLPAIRMMKSMVKEPRLVLRSNAKFADGLNFNTRDIAQDLSALRQRCGW
ncbi:type VI secretion system-associated protein VasI [Vibrio nitrifigilis]|uniref:Type VI secretion system-associated protein TagO n=1 Tax=Vibrio nitrifigilis TaxID=2789781 RepID=A0ABS0GLZ4_9VIBR|nr:type VI secretion system-associated protein VasI [Vibrio nitrifigilis]MBF9003335.1 type VI secretion system-associated protein TagO [Vibrio nitrifigilis]